MFVLFLPFACNFALLFLFWVYRRRVHLFFGFLLFMIFYSFPFRSRAVRIFHCNLFPKALSYLLLEFESYIYIWEFFYIYGSNCWVRIPENVYLLWSKQRIDINICGNRGISSQLEYGYLYYLSNPYTFTAPINISRLRLNLKLVCWHTKEETRVHIFIPPLFPLKAIFFTENVW